MKFAVAAFIFALLALSAYLLTGRTTMPETASAAPATAAPGSPVLLELYTSEGCSSCPPADRLLTKLATQPNVITLAFHVDYWNGEGWNDRFSSPLYTQRQQIYSTRFNLESTYTPQMVVNGVRQFIGSDPKKADEAIADAAKTKLAPLAVTIEAGKLKVSASDLSAEEMATVYMAVAEDGLMNNVSGGENRGATLGHTSVVRSLRAIGMVEKKQRSFETSVDVPTEPDWKKENLNYVLFVQENSSRKIIGVGRVRS